jgi:bifunctional ADP-heptose synthase (sugar kinase/adenylyltransferase)
VVDTTGAGDLYAAGFLHGYANGKPLDVCGKLGSLAAGLVIQQIGPRPQLSLKDAARRRPPEDSSEFPAPLRQPSHMTSSGGRPARER